jgi:hypothetical protein
MNNLPSFIHPAGLIWIGTVAALAAQSTWTPATREALPTVVSSGLTPGGFRMEIAAPPGDYRFERSTTMLAKSWMDLGAVNTVNGTGVAVDAGALSLPKAFYRVAGGFEETQMKLIAFDATLSSASITDPEVFVWGGLQTRQSLENLLFQTAEPTSGLVRVLGGTSGSFVASPNLDSRIFTWVESIDEPEVLPVTISGDILSIQAEEGPIEFRPIEDGGHSRLGMARQNDTFIDGDFTSVERSLETLWVIAKSQNAQPSALAGDWGFVRILSAGYENVDLIDGIGFLDGLVFPTSITSGPNPRTLTVGSAEGFEIEHAWGLAPAEVDSLFYTDNPNVTVSLDLAMDGGVTLTVPGENAFRGMVSPSAKLLVAASSTPDITSDPGNEGQDSGEVQWLVGVKRTNTPALAGKTYRVLRQGWWVDGDFFEIDRGDSTDRLVFNAGGTLVERTSAFIFDTVSFDGVLDNGTDPAELEMSVTINAQGRILMEDSVAGEYTVKTLGFAQEGGGLLVLVDCIETAEGAAGLGLMIAIEEP